jgi:hypothetical protein
VQGEGVAVTTADGDDGVGGVGGLELLELLQTLQLVNVGALLVTQQATDPRAARVHVVGEGQADRVVQAEGELGDVLTGAEVLQLHWSADVQLVAGGQLTVGVLTPHPQATDGGRGG